MPAHILSKVMIWLLGIACTTGHATETGLPSDSRISLAVIGDQPYSPWFEGATTALLQHIAQNSATQWVLHVGDIKGGGEPCSNELINHRVTLLNNSPKPLVLVPGDNEWTDCHRPSAGRYNPQERLQYLREIAFNKPSSLGQTQFDLRTQSSSGYPEHAMWMQGRTLFISLNIPGSNNDLANPTSRKTSSKQVQTLFEHRMQATENWLAQAQQLFEGRSPPLQTVVAIQGNPFEGSGRAWKRGEQQLPHGYAPLLGALVRFIERTERPLLLVHGDTHRHRWDQPSLKANGASAKVDPLFYRLEAWGHPFVNVWIKLNIREGASQPFEIEQITLPSTAGG